MCGNRWAVVCLGVLLGASVAPGQQKTGTIQGVVRFTGEVPPAKQLPRGDGGMIEHHDLVVDAKTKGLRWVIAALEDAPEQKFEGDETPVLIDQQDYLFVPRVVAVQHGQVTPGPVFTTATFIGYLLGGPTGAAVATVGIFLPAFVFVALSVPLLPRLRRSKVAGAFLDGVNAASLALMAVVTVQLGRAALVDWLTVTLAVASAALLLRFRVNATWLVLGGATVGLVRAVVAG